MKRTHWEPTARVLRTWRASSSTAPGLSTPSVPTCCNARRKPASNAAPSREAVAAIQEAIAARKRAGDIVGLGNALRISARLHWLCGQSEVAEEPSADALEVLRDHPDTWQYAMALSGQSQLDMLADRNDVAIVRANEAMSLAESAFGAPTSTCTR